ncbi:hypothetical protein BSL78_11793 [Apostichopus japonicus]|uniref:Uncharacterized protein n=1 Tax=Stichopus japonicus TaxID=307972 RepID=A0A2G8KTI8_STIJA|nr:hypothetical protein BSL78_11793 [Apostichopus japonicus]
MSIFCSELQILLKKFFIFTITVFLRQELLLTVITDNQRTLTKTPSKSDNEPETTFSDAHVYEHTIIKTSSSDTELKPSDIHTEFDKAITSCGEPKDAHIYEHNIMKTSSSDTELKSADIHRKYDKPITSLSEPKDAHVYEYTIFKTSSSDTEAKPNDIDREFDISN